VANQSKSGFTQSRGSRLELVPRNVEHKQVLIRGTRLGPTTLVACQLNVPVAPRSSDKCTVIAGVSREPTKLLKTQDANIKVKTCRNLTDWSSYSHRRGRERLSAHDLHCRGEASCIHPAPTQWVLPLPATLLSVVKPLLCEQRTEQ